MTQRHKNQVLEMIADDWRRNETLEENRSRKISNLRPPYAHLIRIAMIIRQ